jgi:hypothetical protein
LGNASFLSKIGDLAAKLFIEGFALFTHHHSVCDRWKLSSNAVHKCRYC